MIIGDSNWTHGLTVKLTKFTKSSQTSQPRHSLLQLALFHRLHFPKRNNFAPARMRFIVVPRCAGNKALFSFGLSLIVKKKRNLLRK